MALDLVKRAIVAVGDEFGMNKIGTKFHQMIHLTDAAGAVSGIATNPAAMQLRTSGGTEIGTAADPVGVQLRDATGQPFGASTDPLHVNIRSRSAAGDHYVTPHGAAETSKDLAGPVALTLLSIKVQINPTIAAARWAFVYDDISAVPAKLRDRILIPPGGQGSEEYAGLTMASGLFVTISEDFETLVVPAAADVATWVVEYSI